MPAHPTHPFDLHGRTALVTGAGRGIGRSCAITLARAGAEVWLTARSADEIAAVAQQMRDEGGSAHAVACDATDSAAMRAVIADIPVLDVLVNNAGTNTPRAFVDVGEDELDALLALNLRAMFLVAQAAAKGEEVAGVGGGEAGGGLVEHEHAAAGGEGAGDFH